MVENGLPQFITLRSEPLITSITEKSFTLSPTTERGDIVTPAIEKLSCEPSANMVSVNRTPAIQSPAGEDIMVGAPVDGVPGRATSAYETALVERSTEEIDAINSITSQKSTANSLKDRQNRLMAELLTRFTNLVKLATAPEEDGAALESQASLSLQMEVETTALVKAIEDLHRLTRDLKELWLAGPLRSIGEGEDDGDMADNATEVQKLVDGIMNKVRELNGGKDVQSK